MKRFLPLALLLICFGTVPAFCQTAPKFYYLLVQLKRTYDPETDLYFFKIEAEANNPHAKTIRELVRYTPKQRAGNAAEFYASKSDSTRLVFNYFNSISEALEFLDVQGWQLFSINEKVNSYRGAREYSSGSIESETMYYLRKEKP